MVTEDDIAPNEGGDMGPQADPSAGVIPDETPSAPVPTADTQPSPSPQMADMAPSLIRAGMTPPTRSQDTTSSPRIMQMLQGNGAAPQEALESAKQKADPQGQMDATSRTAAAVMGDPSGALLQAARVRHDLYKQKARGELNSGNLAQAASDATHSNGNVPDGTDIMFNANPVSGASDQAQQGAPITATIKNAKTGETSQLPLSTEQFHEWLAGPGSHFDKQMTADAGLELQKVAQGPGRPLEQINQGAQQFTANDPTGRTSKMLPASQAYAQANPEFAKRLQAALQSGNSYAIAKLGNEANQAGYGRGQTDNDLSMNPMRVVGNPDTNGTVNGRPYKDVAAENDAHQAELNKQQPLLRVVRGGIGNPVDRATGQPVTFGQPKDLIGLQGKMVQEQGKNDRANAANAIKSFSAEAQAAGRYVHELMSNASANGKTPSAQQYQQWVNQAAARFKVQPAQVNQMVDLVHTLGPAGASAENPLPPPSNGKAEAGKWYTMNGRTAQWTGTGWSQAPQGQQQGASTGASGDFAAGHVGNQPYYLANEGLNPGEAAKASAQDQQQRDSRLQNYTNERRNEAEAKHQAAQDEAALIRARAEAARSANSGYGGGRYQRRRQ